MQQFKVPVPGTFHEGCGGQIVHIEAWERGVEAQRTRVCERCGWTRDLRGMSGQEIADEIRHFMAMATAANERLASQQAAD